MKKFNFILLWVIGCFGIFGLHRFYLGFKTTGFVWLFTMGGFMIGAIYDILNIDKLIAKSEGRQYKSKEKKRKKARPQSIKKYNENIPNSKKVVGRSVRFIIIYKKGPQQNMEENLIGVFGQAEAKRLINAKYMNNNVQRISWVNDSCYYE